MKFIAGAINGEFLLQIHEKAIHAAESVSAAIAYAAGEDRIIRDCLNNNIPLDYYGRYDGSAPVALPILKLFLDAKSPGFVCKLVPDIFHPKVIWWKGVGAYIGSANLTSNGWFGNIEAGIYLDDSELAEFDIDEELENFFSFIDSKSHLLSIEVYEELQALSKVSDRQKSEKTTTFDRTRLLPHLALLTYVNAKSTDDELKRAFSTEWSDTIQLLRDIGTRVSADEFRPSWISKDVPQGVQVDQFLHAYYYSQVREGNKSKHNKLHDENAKTRERALVNAMNWWQKLTDPPHDERVTVEEWAPFLRVNLDQKKLLSLTADEFTEVYSRVHAARDHCLRVSKLTLGLLVDSESKREERVRLLGQWLFLQKSQEGSTVIQTIDYVLYGGAQKNLPDRLWEAHKSAKWRIPHFGVSTLGELVGWALPNEFPPRNGRTSKALYALGNMVRIHSI